MPAQNQAGAQGGTGTTNEGQGAGQGSGSGSYVVDNSRDGNAAGAQGAARGGAGDGHGSARERREAGASAIADRLVARHGSAERALEVLTGDNYDLRETIRTQTEQLRQVPPNGAVVLVGDDVKAWNVYKALNLPPETVKARLDEHATLSETNKRNALTTMANDAATAVGYKNPILLGELLNDKGLQLDMRDTVVVQADKTTKTVKMPYVRKAGDTNGHYTALVDYFTANLAPYVPALNTAPAQGAGGTNNQQAQGAQGAQGAAGSQSTTGQSSQGGQQHVVVMNGEQASGAAAGGSTDPVAARLAAMKAETERPNALRPAATK